MNKFFQLLFLFRKFEIQTKLSKEKILKRVESFADPKYTDYYGGVSESGFFIGEKNIKSSAVNFGIVRTHNSFAPVARGKIVEKDGATTVTTVIRMNLLVLIIFVPIYLLSLITVVMFPLMLILAHFAFVKPAERLKHAIEDLLIENEA